ncbi:unnamed protein product [Didymodactylos carnosus]|uniref:HTH psq-type domain-containing protein n=1 Tax=Didymodactylos carnosus TaxID=1234261 RepID=A0A814QZQ2_9BILA|nr:unnamed protein product [Didymodactylos carnosus]CAF1126767.1 unnamed protein product [Didymodactylos carnosus]CAF3779160.1 unnamed protein product [Didymodactylos carnosus]CAF3890223.1 unnamed protein product [Didymodactylos carnosus]
MVRNYVRKRVQTSSNADIGEAIKSIKHDKMTINEASVKYNVLISTLYNRLSGHNGSSARGGTTILSKEEESHLVYVIKTMRDYDHPVSNSNVCTMAWWYMTELKKDIPDNGPGKDWFYGFMRRWSPELKIMKSMKLEKHAMMHCPFKFSIVGLTSCI